MDGGHAHRRHLDAGAPLHRPPSRLNALALRLKPPVLTLCKRLQIQCQPEGASAAEKRVLHHVRAVWREGGVGGFYRGLGAAVARGIVLNAVVFPAYEETKRLLTG